MLGTTGIVEPMSEQALVDTIHVELRQRRANGADYVLLTPGNYGADFIRASIGLDPRTAVLTSNFIGDALEHCRALGFRGALLVRHIGKLVEARGRHVEHTLEVRRLPHGAHRGACRRPWPPARARGGGAGLRDV
ncbi:MAG: cobalt-precorrin-5B (C(1))-methyltransferase [Acutalibacteraceae bacterium]